MTLFTKEEWQELQPSLRRLGEFGAASAMIEIAERSLANWDDLTPGQKDQHFEMVKRWPGFEESESDLPPEVAEAIPDWGEPTSAIRSCRNEMWNRVAVWRQKCRHEDPEALQADINELLKAGASSAEAAKDLLQSMPKETFIGMNNMLDNMEAANR